MNKIILLLTGLLVMSFTTERNDNVHQYEENLINGENVSLSSFEGDVLLIVNTASKCGYTPQYEGLQAIYEEFSDQGFKVLGFPANNFAGQEPGSDEEIAQFCEMNYGVTFPMFTKVSVKGDDIHPLFEYLTKAENPDFTGDIGWNFEKFLVDGNGNLIRRFKSNVTPESEEITSAIQELL
jgi:glutathione peroxidase